MTNYYLELNHNAELVLDNSDIKIVSGVNDALPVCLVSDLSFSNTETGVRARFSSNIYYSLIAKSQGKQTIKSEQYYVPENIVAQLGIIDVTNIDTVNIIDSIQLMLYQYLKTLPVVLPNGDITENLIFENWIIKEFN